MSLIPISKMEQERQVEYYCKNLRLAIEKAVKRIPDEIKPFVFTKLSEHGAGVCQLTIGWKADVEDISSEDAIAASAVTPRPGNASTEDNEADVNGTNDNGRDGNNTNDNGADDNGTDDNSADDNSADDNGRDGNSTDNNGAGDNGAEGNGTDDNGTENIADTTIAEELFEALEPQAISIKTRYTKTTLDNYLKIWKHYSRSQILQFLYTCEISKKEQSTLQAFIYSWWAERYSTSGCSSVADFAAKGSASSKMVRCAIDNGRRISILERSLKGSGIFALHAKTKFQKIRFLRNDANHFIARVVTNPLCQEALIPLASFQEVYSSFEDWMYQCHTVPIGTQPQMSAPTDYALNQHARGGLADVEFLSVPNNSPSVVVYGQGNTMHKRKRGSSRKSRKRTKRDQTLVTSSKDGIPENAPHQNVTLLQIDSQRFPVPLSAPASENPQFVPEAEHLPEHIQQLEGTETNRAVPDLSTVQNLEDLFSESAIQNFDLRAVQTFDPSTVQNLEGLFPQSTVQNFDPSTVQNLEDLFPQSTVQNFNPSTVQNLEGLFVQSTVQNFNPSAIHDLEGLSTQYTVQNFDPSTVQNLEDLFSRSAIENLDLCAIQDFDISAVQNLEDLFT